MWNLEQQYFEVGAHILIVEVEDIYFLTGLLRQGAPISLTGSHGGYITTQELIDCHCIPGTRTSGNKIPIKAVVDGPLPCFLPCREWREAKEYTRHLEHICSMP